MNKDQALGLIKIGAAYAAGQLSGRGYISAADVGPYTDLIVQFASAAIALAVAAWSAYSHTKANTIAAAAAVPGVTAIVVSSQAVANAAPANVVTPNDIAAGNAPSLSMTDSRL